MASSTRPCLPQSIAQVVVGLREVGLMRKRLSVCGYCAIQLPLLKEYPCVCTQSLRRGQALSAAGRKIQPALQADSAYSHMYAQMGNKLPEQWLQLFRGTQTEMLLILWTRGLAPSRASSQQIVLRRPSAWEVFDAAPAKLPRDRAQPGLRRTTCWKQASASSRRLSSFREMPMPV